MRAPSICPSCGSPDVHSHSLSWWCLRCRDGANFDGSVRSRSRFRLDRLLSVLAAATRPEGEQPQPIDRATPDPEDPR